jgi:hypothetical protein
MATSMTVPPSGPQLSGPPEPQPLVAAALVRDDGLRRTRATALAHLSVEIGHLYADQLDAEEGVLAEVFARAIRRLPMELHEPLVADGEAPHRPSPDRPSPGRLGPHRGSSPRLSTCVLIDDYSTTPAQEPGSALPRVIAAARRAGLRLDYLAREAACARVNNLSPVAAMVRALVAEPPEGTTGTRPAAYRSGWACNGVRSPGPVGPAMSPTRWQPPRQSAPEGLSVVVDVELWSPYDADATEAPPVTADLDRADRRWSCAALAASWQLLRLGLLRHRGEPLWRAEEPPDPWPATWSELPPLIRLRPEAAPFAAYRTLSLLPGRFLLPEAGVRTILGQVAADPELLAEVAARADAEGTPVPTRIDDRVEYVFYTER